MKKWKKIDSKIIFEHPRINLAEDTVEIPSGEHVKYLTFVGVKDFVTIVPVKYNGEILMTRELAYPVNEVLLQFPEGECDYDETIIEAAKREFLEETGYEATTLELIGERLGHHRRSKMKGYVFLATGINKITNPKGDLEEGDIQTVSFHEKEINNMISRGEIVHNSALSAWATYLAHKSINP
jgi:ADP-ribose pyrophosphatase